jgi:hypothetical protein
MTPYFTVSYETPNLEGQVFVFISPRNRVAQIFPRALGSLSVASYDSQGYSVGILTRLHTPHESAATSKYPRSQISPQLLQPAVRYNCVVWVLVWYSVFKYMEHHAQL